MVLSNVLRDTQNVSDSEEFHQALVVLCKLLAPMAPHISSELWEGECGAHVHPLETLIATLHQDIQLASPLNKNISSFFFFGPKKKGASICYDVFTVNHCVVDVTVYSKPLCCDVFTVNHCVVDVTVYSKPL